MTIKEILIKYSNDLENISDTPRLDVEMLLKKALGDVDSMYIRMYLDKELTDEQEKYFLEMIKERLNERPIAYIIGNREFMGLDFFVKEGVLIPRPDTETLVEEIINICNNKSELNILDIGTGSGAITIVSNPPYIKKEDIPGLDRQVKDFEPYNALEGGEDGLDFYRKITEESKYFLKNKGILAYEVGHDQASDVIQIMKENGFESIYNKCDLQGFERVVIGFYNN